MVGKIKFYNENKGYGFITTELITKEEGHMTANKENLNEVQDYFFHVSGLLYENPKRNEPVSFELQNTDRGVKAVNIQRNN